VAADPAACGSRSARRFEASGTPFWLHLDVDVLDEREFPATDYLMPGGLDMSQLAQMLLPLGRSDALAGVSVGCYNPDKDPDGSCGQRLTDLLVQILGDRSTLEPQ